MGLSGARQKQRIPDDPRNTRWANDTAAPGFKMLSQMGWTKDTVLGNANSQTLIAEGGSQTGLSTRKKISSIPVAKSDKVGIGAGRAVGGAGIGGLRAMGTAMSGMGFVTATEGGSGASTPGTAVVAPTGGEFGRLLERLNAAKEKAAAEAAAEGGVVEESKVVEVKDVKELSEKEQKKLRKAEKKRKREAEGEGEEVEEVTKVALVETTTTTGTTTTTTTTAVPILKNPRMAARSKHLRAKRMATADNAAAMAEILGIAPPGSTPIDTPVYTSAPTSGTSTPTFSAASTGLPASTSRPLQVNGATGDNGWPTVPPRSRMGMASMFAPSSSGGIQSTFAEAGTQETKDGEEAAEAPVKSAFGGGLGSMFAKASTGGLGSTFAPSSTGGIGATREEESPKAEASTSAASAEDVGMDDAAKAKADARDKRIAKKAEGKLKKAAWLAAKAGASAGPAAEEAAAPVVAAVEEAAEEVAAVEVDDKAARKAAKAEKKAKKEAKRLKKAAKEEKKGKKAKKESSSDSDSD